MEECRTAPGAESNFFRRGRCRRAAAVPGIAGARFSKNPICGCDREPLRRARGYGRSSASPDARASRSAGRRVGRDQVATSSMPAANRFLRSEENGNGLDASIMEEGAAQLLDGARLIITKW